MKTESFGNRASITLLVTMFASVCFEQSAAQMLFPESEWGKARMAVQQSASRLESLFQVADANFEPLSEFSNQSHYQQLAKPIGRLNIRAQDSYGQRGVIVCTAWLVASDLALTNHHCIPGTGEFRLLAAQLRLGYLSDRGQSGDVYPVSLDPVETDPKLDYSLVRVYERPTDKYGVVAIAPGDASPGEELFIVHHPLGKPLQLTRWKCRATSWQNDNSELLNHRCETMTGSSGAPIFSLTTRKVVGLHFKGGLDENADSYNSAKRLQRIIADSARLTQLARPGQEEPSSGGELAQCDMSDAHALSLCRTALRGDAEAQFEIGTLYHDGNGVRMDDEAAVYWYKMAAQNDNTSAQVNLGYMYEKGYGVPLDREKFFYWTQLAARGGNITAQRNLGEAYELGTGVAVDLELAAYWYGKGAEQGSERAKQRIDHLHATDTALFDLGYAYYEAGPDEYNGAVYWYEKAARKGNASAMNNLGFMYRNGYGLAVDHAEAVRWYREAADLGNAMAKFNLGNAYRDGVGVRQNTDKARMWYTVAAEAGNADAKEALNGLD